MRSILGSTILSLICVEVIRARFDGFVISSSDSKTLILVSIGMGAITLFAKPLLRIISLPASGVGFLIVGFFLNLISFYLMDTFLGAFEIRAGKLTGLNPIGFVVDSYRFSLFWSYALVSFSFTLMNSILSWVFGRDK